MEKDFLLQIYTEDNFKSNEGLVLEYNSFQMDAFLQVFGKIIYLKVLVNWFFLMVLIIKEFIKKYENGARYEGDFDGSPLERFLDGQFNFANQFKFTGQWKDGYITKGTLFYKNVEVASFNNQMNILREKNGNGVIISSSNKWFYEGGIKNKKFNGEGCIYCSFQQYKKGNFKDDKVNGDCYKMSLNWGEISYGSYEMNAKRGPQTRITNNGYKIYYNDSQYKTTFPYINNDYFEGKVSFKKDTYEVTFLNGYLYQIENEKIMQKKKLQNVINLPLQNIQFEFTYQKIMIEEKKISFLQEAIKYINQIKTINFEQLPLPLSDFNYLKKIQSPQFKNIQKIDSTKEKTFQKQIQKAYFKQLKSHRNPSRKISKIQQPNNNNLHIPIKISPSPSKNRVSNELKYSEILPKKQRENSHKKTNSLLLNINDYEQFDKFVNKKITSKRSKSKLMEDDDDNLTMKQSKRSNSVIGDENISIFNVNPTSKRKNYTPENISLIISPDPTLEDDIEFFEGTIIKKQKNGFCRIVYKSGLFIEANFRLGQADGEGIMILPNGLEYSGNFKKGYFEGLGNLTVDKTIYKGKFKKGIFQSDIVHTNSNNQHFIFESKNEKNHMIGQVNIHLSNGFSILKCKFEKNKIHPGPCILKDDLGVQWPGRIKLLGGQRNYVFQSQGKRVKKFQININEGIIYLNQLFQFLIINLLFNHNIHILILLHLNHFFYILNFLINFYNIYFILHLQILFHLNYLNQIIYFMNLNFYLMKDFLDNHFYNILHHYYLLNLLLNYHPIIYYIQKYHFHLNFLLENFLNLLFHQILQVNNNYV